MPIRRRKGKPKGEKTGGGVPRPTALVLQRRADVERAVLDGYVTPLQVHEKLAQKYPDVPLGTIQGDYQLLMQRWMPERVAGPEEKAAAAATLRDHVRAARADGAWSGVAALERLLRGIEGTLPMGAGAAVAVQVNVGGGGAPAAPDLSRLNSPQATVSEHLASLLEGALSVAPLDAELAMLAEDARRADAKALPVEAAEAMVAEWRARVAGNGAAKAPGSPQEPFPALPRGEQAGEPGEGQGGA